MIDGTKYVLNDKVWSRYYERHRKNTTTSTALIRQMQLFIEFKLQYHNMRSKQSKQRRWEVGTLRYMRHQLQKKRVDE